MRNLPPRIYLVCALCCGCRSRRGGGDADGDADADADVDADGAGDADGDSDPVECALGCPATYSCSAQGICEGGDPLELVLDIQTVPVAGRVTLNGERPGTGSECDLCPD